MSSRVRIVCLALGLFCGFPHAESLASPPPTPSICAGNFLDHRGAVVVSWSDVAGETGYRLYRDGVAIGAVGAGVTALEDLDVQLPGTHSYCVESFNADGASPQCCGTADIPTPPILVQPWNWFNDAFPTRVSPPDFRREPAKVQTGFNTAAFTTNLSRLDVPGDTLLVAAAGSDVRMDLVFRIDPGPGNYSVVGNRNSPLRRVPTGTAIATPGDGSFWGEYMANRGPVGTGGNGTTGTPMPGGRWDPQSFCSAMIDTAEVNLFPSSDSYSRVPELYMSTYHESEVGIGGIRNALGVPKNRCFSDGGTIVCGGPTYTLVAATYAVSGGLPPVGSECSGCSIGQTLEFTKILPDNLFTPGTHIEYFLRRSNASSPGTYTAIVPDTTRVTPQLAQGSIDGHRWEQLNVLPDLWKDVTYSNTGPGGPAMGLACLLVVDMDDGNGDERTWISAADSIGATRPNRSGAGVGWRPASPDTNLNFDGLRDPVNRGQPGTTWDLYRSGEPPTAKGMPARSAAATGSPRSHFARTAPRNRVRRSRRCSPITA